MSGSNGVAPTLARYRNAPPHGAGSTRPDLLSTGEVAYHLGVSPRTAARLIDEKRLRGYRIPGSQDRRVHRSDLETFMADHGMTASRRPQAVVLAIGCPVVDDGGMVVVAVSSSFDAGVVVAARRPVVILADAALGRLELGQIAAGCRTLEGYEPVLVVGGNAADIAAGPASVGFHAVLARPVRGADLAGLLNRE